MAKLNHIRRYRFDDETNLALQKLGKKEAQEVRQCIRVFCSLEGTVGDRETCKKSQCRGYTSKSGRGVCSHRGKLFKKGEKVNVKNLIK